MLLTDITYFSVKVTILIPINLFLGPFISEREIISFRYLYNFIVNLSHAGKDCVYELKAHELHHKVNTIGKFRIFFKLGACQCENRANAKDADRIDGKFFIFFLHLQ